jgi:hypothetical protein
MSLDVAGWLATRGGPKEFSLSVAGASASVAGAFGGLHPCANAASPEIVDNQRLAWIGHLAGAEEACGRTAAAARQWAAACRAG